MKFIKPKTHKKCPRCGNKCLINQTRCEECDLLFSRLEYASNKAAKKKLRKFDTDFVIYTNQYPKDVNWYKLMAMTFFTGIFGGHYYYTGKYIKGIIMSMCFIYAIFCTIFNSYLVNSLESFLYIPIGLEGMAWIISLIYVCCKKYKVPVIVEMPDETAEQILDKETEKRVKEFKKEAKELKKQAKEKKVEDEQKLEVEKENVDKEEGQK
ncbi:MAG: hypothetical protein K2K31_02920 [Clostridia bacterium]|nr:hypothetical protein [Clostridia bacterium]